VFEQLLNWIHFSHWSWLLPWLFGLSVVVFIGSIIVGWLIHVDEILKSVVRDTEILTGPNREAA